MRQEIKGRHYNDENGNPAGGLTYGKGLQIEWQNGPLGRGTNRLEPNGAFVDGVIAAALDRLQYYERSKFTCEENKLAIQHLEFALAALDIRTRNRETQNVEGTHTVHE